MALQLVAIPIIFSLVVLVEYEMIANATPNISKPGCPDRCGNLNISIPYPFGTEPNCYLDEWFELACNTNSTPHKLVLKRLNMEVFNISLNTLRVKSPVIYSSSGCSNRKGSNSIGAVNITESPFRFSSAYNTFTAVGCDNLALVDGVDPTVVVGCKSHCETNNYSSSSIDGCQGIGCCQTNIPSEVGVFDVKFNSIRNNASGNNTVEYCKFALLIDDYWSGNLHRIDPFHLQYRVDIPVVLDWYIYNFNNHFKELFDTLVNGSRTSFWNTDALVNGSLTSLRSWDITSSDSGLVLRFQSSGCWPGYEGNPYLGCEDVNECEDPELNRCPHQCENTEGSYRCGTHMLSTILGVSISFGVPTLVMILWWLYNVIKKRNEVKLKKKLFKRNGGLLLQQQVSSTNGNVEATKIFSSTELEKATDHFNESRIIGQGGQGTVYKGMLDDGRIVAIKKSKGVDEGVNLEQFINEVVILSQINHRNVVNLLGCCLETEVPLLVYEYIPNGTLFQYLHDQTEEFLLTWNVRLRIAREVAGALSYLHSAASIPIYHRDIKSTNILLDEKYRAKVADFGTSRSVAIDQTHLTTFVHGTFGYLDPDYFHTSQFTEKSDVYSFGVVLAELLTGEKPISFTRSQEARGLAIYFVFTVEENHLFDILDPRIEKEGNNEEIIAVAELAKNCLNWNSKRRPTMREVAMKLEIVHGVHENCEELKYDVSEEIELWEAASMPTMSLESGATSSSDVRPLLFPETV